MPYHLTPLGRTALRRSKTAYPRLSGCESGFRFFSPGMGRWTSRDPMGEKGGKNIYVFARNRMGNAVDKLGLKGCCSCFMTRLDSSGGINSQFRINPFEMWVGLTLIASSDVVGDRSLCKYEWKERGSTIVTGGPDGVPARGPVLDGPQPIGNPYIDRPGHYMISDLLGIKWDTLQAGHYTISMNMRFTASCTGTDGSKTEATTSVLDTRSYSVDVNGNPSME